MMATVWTLVADSSRARLFELEHPGRGIREFETVVNPEGRAKGRDLQSDGYGRFYGKGERHQAHTAPPSVSPVEHDVDLFAKSLADRLAQARVEGRYQRLCLIAAPKFLGAVRGHLEKNTARMIDLAFDKELTQAPADDIEQLLRAGWRPR